MSPLFRKGRREEGEARVSQVEMVERTSYGEAKVRIVYSVQPSTDEPFEVIRETKVRMLHLPQAGQIVQVSFDPGDHDRFEVVTPPGEETGEVAAPTVEIPWAESERSSYVRPDGTRGFR
jgi:hypothetical protein